jgi:hypothetical protein
MADRSKTYPAATITEPDPKPAYAETPAEVPAESKPEPSPDDLIKGFVMGKDFLEYADPKCRPPGEIAAQRTTATGNWIRARYSSGTPGSWQKSSATDQKVFSASRKFKTVTEAVASLVSL